MISLAICAMPKLSQGAKGYCTWTGYNFLKYLQTIVRTSDIRVSERICMENVTINKHSTVYNDLLDEVGYNFFFYVFVNNQWQLIIGMIVMFSLMMMVQQKLVARTVIFICRNFVHYCHYRFILTSYT